MADPSPPPASALVIPPDVQEKFGPLLELIKASESMNNEERQYWINILAVMTPGQIKNLEEILMNEKSQLAAIDRKYNKEAADAADRTMLLGMEQKIRTKTQERQRREQEEATKEEVQETDLLAEIQKL